MLRYLNEVAYASPRKMRLIAIDYARWLVTLPEHKDDRKPFPLAEDLAEGHVTIADCRKRVWEYRGDTWWVANLMLCSDRDVGRSLLKELYLLAEQNDREHDRDPAIRDSIVRGLLHCIVGNPFRPVACDPSWRTSSTVALADAIYAGRAFDRLPVLADSLEEAGCDHPDVLAHCRGPGPHARGCWVVDMILGKA